MAGRVHHDRTNRLNTSLTRQRQIMGPRLHPRAQRRVTDVRGAGAFLSDRAMEGCVRVWIQGAPDCSDLFTFQEHRVAAARLLGRCGRTVVHGTPRNSVPPCSHLQLPHTCPITQLHFHLCHLSTVAPRCPHSINTRHSTNRKLLERGSALAGVPRRDSQQLLGPAS